MVAPSVTTPPVPAPPPVAPRFQVNPIVPAFDPSMPETRKAAESDRSGDVDAYTESTMESLKSGHIGRDPAKGGVVGYSEKGGFNGDLTGDGEVTKADVEELSRIENLNKDAPKEIRDAATRNGVNAADYIVTAQKALQEGRVGKDVDGKVRSASEGGKDGIELNGDMDGNGGEPNLKDVEELARYSNAQFKTGAETERAAARNGVTVGEYKARFIHDMSVGTFGVDPKTGDVGADPAGGRIGDLDQSKVIDGADVELYAKLANKRDDQKQPGGANTGAATPAA
jgi:hypothetical protein